MTVAVREPLRVWRVAPVGGNRRETPAREMSADPSAWSRWGRRAALLLLAGLLIFCHPCHGEDVDDELFADGWWVAADVRCPLSVVRKDQAAA